MKAVKVSLYILASVAAMFLVAAALVGCSATPLTRADMAVNSLDSATKVLTQARKDGYISNSDKANISIVLHTADASLHTYEQDVIANPNGSQVQSDAAAFWTAFAQVEPYVVKYLAAKQTATTQPTK